MLLEIFEQIEKELKYAELKHPNQKLDKTETYKVAANKLADCITTGPHPLCCYSCCLKCNDSNRFICSSLATIAILIRGIERELELKGSKIFKNRNKLFKEILKERTVIRLNDNNVSIDVI